MNLPDFLGIFTSWIRIRICPSGSRHIFMRIWNTAFYPSQNARLLFVLVGTRKMRDALSGKALKGHYSFSYLFISASEPKNIY